jgi:hypothetical protein
MGDGIDFPELKDEVKELQRKLRFSESQIDGKFGLTTEAAVKRFQSDKGLLADGIVGENTWTALFNEKVVEFAPHPVKVGNFDVDKIIDSIPFPNIRVSARTSVPLILNECLASNVTDRGQIAYILATAEHEAHLGEWMEEFSTGIEYEGFSELGNHQPGDGPRFKGRGFVQITGRRNYTDWSSRLSIDLLSLPEQAAEPAIAAKILVQGMRDGTFTGLKLSDFISGETQNFVNARKIINGLDKAKSIAAIAAEYLEVL